LAAAALNSTSAAISRVILRRPSAKGQQIDVIATDIYRNAGGRIAENWYLEDNLTLLQQPKITVFFRDKKQQ
jgi:hypothetical protein